MELSFWSHHRARWRWVRHAQNWLPAVRAQYMRLDLCPAWCRLALTSCTRRRRSCLEPGALVGKRSCCCAILFIYFLVKLSLKVVYCWYYYVASCFVSLFSIRLRYLAAEVQRNKSVTSPTHLSTLPTRGRCFPFVSWLSGGLLFWSVNVKAFLYILVVLWTRSWVHPVWTSM